jgi:hypothetical protein
MTVEQALKFLMQVLITKPGLSLTECAAVVAAWNTIAAAVTPPPDPPKE